jgi:uncharacterized spore protein YtfJ
VGRTGEETEDPVKIDELVATARDAVTVKRVFGEPYEHNGITVITAAAVTGGGGGGGGHDSGGQEGEGGGFGMTARPAGAYVIKDGVVSWRPAVDVNRMIAAVAAVSIFYLITRGRARKARAKAVRAAALRARHERHRG